jgi:glyoxylase-like metal-dependent hydrolase (beta-lactamase superfamily II)
MEEKRFGPLWFLPGENSGKSPFCHSLYVVEAGLLIDPAPRRERLVELSESSGVNTVWLSHWHEDHFMYIDLFDHRPLCISEKDAARFPIRRSCECPQKAYLNIEFFYIRVKYDPKPLDSCY